MSLYRIAWAIGARQGHGEWFSATDLPFLHRTVGVLGARHGPGTHRIEERVVTRAAQMMAEALNALIVGSTGNTSKWHGSAGDT